MEENLRTSQSERLSGFDLPLSNRLEAAPKHLGLVSNRVQGEGDKPGPHVDIPSQYVELGSCEDNREKNQPKLNEEWGAPDRMHIPRHGRIEDESDPIPGLPHPVSADDSEKNRGPESN